MNGSGDDATSAYTAYSAGATSQVTGARASSLRSTALGGGLRAGVAPPNAPAQTDPAGLNIDEEDEHDFDDDDNE